MENYSKTEKKIEKVVSGPVKVRKKSEMRKFADAFITEDFKSIKDYVLNDILLPAIKNTVADTITNGVRMALFGETGTRKTGNGTRISYNSYSSRDNSSAQRTRNRSVYDYGDIILATKGEAEHVLDGLLDLLNSYNIVSVADLYQLVDIQPNATDFDYGWTNLDSADTARVSEGYIVRLPKAQPLRR